MTGEYGFHVIDASRPVRRVAADLRRAVARVIEEEPGTSGEESVKVESPEKIKLSGLPALKESPRIDSQEKAKTA